MYSIQVRDQNLFQQQTLGNKEHYEAVRDGDREALKTMQKELEGKENIKSR